MSMRGHRGLCPRRRVPRDGSRRGRGVQASVTGSSVTAALTALPGLERAVVVSVRHAPARLERHPSAGGGLVLPESSRIREGA
jgi:hypothetical protein